jgi:hypothetical protein
MRFTASSASMSFASAGMSGLQQFYLHACLAQLLDALAVHIGVGVQHPDHHAHDSCASRMAFVQGGVNP